MKYLGAIIVLALSLLAIFTLANWSVLTTPTQLSFVVFQVQGPLGVILLGAMLFLAGVFAAYVLSLRTAMLMDSHRHKQELQVQRKLAENAEASRLKELSERMERGFTLLRDEFAQTDGRIERLEQGLRQTIDETANGLAAAIGEIEEKLDRALAGVNGPAGTRNT